MKRLAAFSLALLTPMLAVAQEVVAPPLPAPSLPDTGTGWVDFLTKFLPVVWGIISPMATQAMVTAFPKLFRKVPRPVLGVFSALLGAAAGALTGGADGLVLDAGGIKPEVGALEGGLSAIAAHKVAAEVTPGAPAKAQP